MGRWFNFQVYNETLKRKIWVIKRGRKRIKCKWAAHSWRWQTIFQMETNRLRTNIGGNRLCKQPAPWKRVWVPFRNWGWSLNWQRFFSQKWHWKWKRRRADSWNSIIKVKKQKKALTRQEDLKIDVSKRFGESRQKDTYHWRPKLQYRCCPNNPKLWRRDRHWAAVRRGFQREGSVEDGKTKHADELELEMQLRVDLDGLEHAVYGRVWCYSRDTHLAILARIGPTYHCCCYRTCWVSLHGQSYQLWHEQGTF